MSDPQSKIIVDDDWKAQVEKEKQLAASGTPEEFSPPAAEPSEPSTVDYPAPPDASFETLLTMLFTQGMAALGQVPGDDGKPMPINKPFAKHFIDTIEMLGEKTTGNLSEDETKMHAEIMHAMRITFVQVKAPKPPLAS